MDKKIAKFLAENYDNLGTYVNLNDDEIAKSMTKIIARHLFIFDNISRPSVARAIAKAFVEYSKVDTNDLLEKTAAIAVPEYNNHAGVAGPEIY